MSDLVFLPAHQLAQMIRLCVSLIVGADLRRPDVPPIPLDTPSGKSLQDLKIAWIDEWVEVPVAAEIRGAIQTVVQKLAQELDKVVGDFRHPLGY